MSILLKYSSDTSYFCDGNWNYENNSNSHKVSSNISDACIFKLDHWLGLGDQKRGKPLSKISLFGILKVFFHMVLCKNGHNATTNGRISTIDGSIHISCSRTIQKSANTRFKVNSRGENVH